MEQIPVMKSSQVKKKKRRKEGIYSISEHNCIFRYYFGSLYFNNNSTITINYDDRGLIIVIAVTVTIDPGQLTYSCQIQTYY